MGASVIAIADQHAAFRSDLAKLPISKVHVFAADAIRLVQGDNMQGKKGEGGWREKKGEEDVGWL